MQTVHIEVKKENQNCLSRRDLQLVFPFSENRKPNAASISDEAGLDPRQNGVVCLFALDLNISRRSMEVDNMCKYIAGGRKKQVMQIMHK